MLFPTTATQYGLAILATLSFVDAKAVVRNTGLERGLADDTINIKGQPLVFRSSEEKRSPHWHSRHDWYNRRPYRTSTSTSTTTSATVSPTAAVVAEKVVSLVKVVVTTTSAAAAVQTTAPATSSGTLTTDQAGALKLHNDGRVAKGLTALVWDDTLAANAQVWANHLASTNQMVHSSGSDRPNQGENLASSWSSNGVSSPMTGGAKMWMDEASAYTGQIIPQGDFASYGHYTQCMWSTTTKVGMAVATAADGTVYTVGRYSEAGNMSGKTPF